MMKTEMRTKEALGCSLSTAEMATPSTHMIVTLYTDIPTYLHRGVWSNITPRKVPYRDIEILRLLVMNMSNGQKGR